MLFVFRPNLCKYAQTAISIYNQTQSHGNMHSDMYMYVQIDGGMCICNIQMCTSVHVCVCECVHVNVQCIYMYYYNRTYLYIIHIYIYIWINTPGKMCHKQIYLWRMEAKGVVLRSWMVAPWGFPPKRWLSLWQDHSVVNEILTVSIIWRAIQPLESLE